MCLSELKEFTPRKDGIGYQVKRKWKLGRYPLYGALFRNEKNTEICSGRMSHCLKKNRWYKANKKDIITYSFFSTKRAYESGFHVYTGLKSAQEMYARGNKIGKCIVKVKFNDVVATGLQHGKRVVVARRIKIIEEV